MDIKDHYTNNQTIEVSHLNQIYNNEQLYKSYQRAYTLKSVYTFDLSKNINSEMGIENVYSTLDDHFKDNPLPPSDVQNQAVTNYFRYNENVVAAFMSFKISQKKWSYAVGLRDEQMYFNSSSQEINKDDFTKTGSNNYLLPTVSITHSFSASQMLMLGLKQNISRPRYSTYNPFMFLSTPIIFVKGNPDLKPSINSNADITYILQPSEKQSYMFVGGINYDEKLIYPQIDIDPVTNKLIFSQQNLSDKQNLYLYISAQNNFSKLFSLQTSLTISKTKYKLLVDSLKGQSKNDPSISFSLNSSYKLPWNINSNLYYQFSSTSITAQGKRKSAHYLSLNISRSIIKNRISAYLDIDNPFHRMKNSEEFNTSFIKGQYKSVSEAAVFKLGVSYKFGKEKNSMSDKQRAIMNSRM